VGLIHQGVEFGLRELGRVDGVGEAEHAAGGAGLDDIRPNLTFERTGSAHGVRTVGHAVLLRWALP
jgi:hypothetical protein